MTDNKPKNYPAATEDVASMLKFNTAKSGEFKHGPESAQQSESMIGSEAIAVKEAESPDFSKEIEADIQAAKKPNFGPLLKLVLPYLILFILGVVAYYFFFSKFNVSGLFRKTQKTVQTTKETALTQLEKQNLEAYTAWIKSYYFDVSDAEVLDPEGDNSGNGLSNFQKFMFKLNPKDYDTLGLGRSDTESLAQGINPLTGSKITDDQQKILDNYVDMEVAMNRLALANSQGRRNVAGASVWSGLRGATQNSFYQPGLERPLEQNSNPSFPSPIQNSQGNSSVSRPFTSPNTGINPSPAAQDTLGINDLDVDTSVAARLEIPSLNINVPIVWTSNTKNFTRDLQNGVVHYPGTALPGQIGTSYISGHSSNYAWAKGNYNQVFATLGDLPDNTSFKITVVQKNGKDARLHYVVTHRKEYKATDQEQFRNTGKSVVALSTCWPVGTTAKRLVVFGEMTQMEKD